MQDHRSTQCEQETIHCQGILYIVATPIGNLEDITLRALKVLREVALIAAEDTRHTGKLLSHYQIKKRLISCHEHNEAARIPMLMDALKSGSDVALVSDAGTPGISDPGYRVVQAALEEGIAVVPVPGASAVVAGLSVCGLPTDMFHFVGFLPKKRGRQREQLEALKSIQATLVFYESPRRIVALLRSLLDTFGDRPATVAREITKLHEEFIRGSLSQLIESFEKRDAVKGECVVFVGGCEQNGPAVVMTDDAIDRQIREALESDTQSPSKVAKVLSKTLSLPKQEIYEKIVKIKSE